MLGRIYTVLFMATIFGSLWYQQVYLDNSMVEFNAQRMAENVVLPTMQGQKYHSFTFENGLLSHSFSGKNITYYSNKKFEATENLVYQQFSHPTPSSAPSGNNVLIQTNKAIGEVSSPVSENSQIISGKNKIKNLVLPNIVHFNVDNNIGVTSDVFFDMFKKTGKTNDPFESVGPDGYLKGVGFFYAMEGGRFKINSDVEGEITPSQLPKQ